MCTVSLPSRSKPASPCRSRPRARFRGQARRGTAALDVIAEPGARGRPRQQGPGDRQGHRRLRPAAAQSSAPMIRTRAPADHYPANGRRARIVIRYASAPMPRRCNGSRRSRRPARNTLSAQPGPADPQPHLDPDPGHPASARPGAPASARPSRLKVVMSGERLTPEAERPDGRARAFRFQDGPAGRALPDRDRRRRSRLPPLGPRTGVWTEPAMLDRGHRVRRHREDGRGRRALYGPYRWGRYDVLVLPPSFPYGGMENPTLTFATPTFIAGDKSLVSAGGPRAGAQLVGQPRHQRDLGRLLAQRRLHLLLREPDHGGDLRPAPRRQEAA